MPEMQFDAEALRAAAESAAAKAAAGHWGTDQLQPTGLAADERAEQPAPDLRTRYLGLTLRNPLVASAGPISQTVEGIKSLADAGVGAVVMYSLFEEQLRYEEQWATRVEEEHAESFAEALTYFPLEPSGNTGVTEQYLRTLEAGAAAVSVPVIASINGSTLGSWTQAARRMQDAGAAAIELNIYFVPGDLSTPAREVEDRHVAILQAVKDVVSVPVAVKCSPYFSSFGAFATRLVQEGADGLVLFNRFLQPDVDLDTMSVEPGFGLSEPAEGRLPRTWLASLHGRVSASLAASTGVETADDVVKFLASGADVVMTTSALVRHGAGYAGELLAGLRGFLAERHLSLQQLRGMLAVPGDADANRYARSGYVSALERAKRVYG